MKIYISADIEGIAGITHWDEASKAKPEYQEFREEMTREVVARTVGVSRGHGSSSISIAPVEARRLIYEGVHEALESDLSACLLALADNFVVEVTYREPATAYGAGFYPGAEQAGPHTIRFETGAYFEVMRLLTFVT